MMSGQLLALEIAVSLHIMKEPLCKAGNNAMFIKSRPEK